MSKHSEQGDRGDLRDRIIGLGERSIRKSYYPMLQDRMAELERFRALIDNTNDAIFLMDARTGRFVDVNDSACMQLGYSREKLLSLGVGSLWAGTVPESVGNLFGPGNEPGDRTTVEAEIAVKEGSYPAEVTFRLVHFCEKDYVVAVARNITKRKKAEEELRRAEKKYRSIFENAVDGIYQSTVSGRFISVNPAMARILGYDTPLELIDSVTDIEQQLYVQPHVRRRLLELVRHREQITDFEAEYYKKDGTKIWASLHARPVYGEDGELRGLEGIFQDITGRKLAEEEKRRLESQLMQSQKMEAVGTLAGGISHDFNNLLQVISGYIQLLMLMKSEKDQDWNYLQEIRKAVARATDLVRRLLTFSRKMEIKPSSLNMNRIIRSTVKLLEHTIPKMITIETRLDPELKEIKADPIQMEQVIMNLANNAVDAMPEGGKLVIETGNVVIQNDSQGHPGEIQPGEYMLLQVSDTGIGMDVKTIEHIFEPFFTTKETGKGTGLGLSTVYGIIKGHLGKIYCTSKPGMGTTFSIYIPELFEALEADISIPEHSTRLEGGREVILLVDDEDLIINIAGEMLSYYGYTALSAKSGEEALEMYSREVDSIDLVVLDLGMPGMGGEKCLEELLKMNPGARVLVSSGYTMHKLAGDPLKFGACGFLAKPYNLEELISRIRHIIEHP